MNPGSVTPGPLALGQQEDSQVIKMENTEEGELDRRGEKLHGFSLGHMNGPTGNSLISRICLTHLYGPDIK